MSNRDYRILICALHSLALVGVPIARLGLVARACRMSEYRARGLILSAVTDGVLGDDMFFISSRGSHMIYSFRVAEFYRADIPAWMPEYEVLAFNL